MFISFQVSVDELKDLLAKYSSTDQMAAKGVTIAGTRYMFLSNTDKVVRAKKGTSGVHTIKTTQGKQHFLYTFLHQFLEGFSQFSLEPTECIR